MVLSTGHLDKFMMVVIDVSSQLFIRYVVVIAW